MSIQDNIFDIEHHIKTKCVELNDAWERVYMNFFLIEQEKNHLDEQITILKQATKIIRGWE